MATGPDGALIEGASRLAYQLFFDKQTPAAIAELDRDIRRTLRGTLRDVASPVSRHPKAS
jgi:soluble epoxide hydrolase/lipid-phosphate phosphatase